MLTECREAPDRVADLLTRDAEIYAAVTARLRDLSPKVLLSIARGSSDHAAAYGLYLLMRRLGIVGASVPPSLLSLYGAPLQAQGLAAFSVSQSGRSPDVVEPMRILRSRGALTYSFLNRTDSPMSAAVEYVFPLHAGLEQSVAATKSVLCSLVAQARLIAGLGYDQVLQARLNDLPHYLARAAAADWSAAVPVLSAAEKLMVVGRGPGFPISLEMALKFKEVTGIQAEAFSGAEIKHGPMAIIGEGYPLLILALPGPAEQSLLALASEMTERGASVVVAGNPSLWRGALPVATCGDTDLDPVLALQSFYPLVEAIAQARGRNPDAPPFLRKETLTV
jgi:glucosamine--fructose-6-phosphate aminotransferase (isomerizing)